ncbi:MAG TPA: hypothetical protein DD381_14790 [Lentisphaeria bacterium]|nr:MAG: hypothetical protein A2X47_05490 [Lentisphaerae bacterium GWF2_38_69]HBM17590.1 hypothetical protein [Lentisphaeria bacterium]
MDFFEVVAKRHSYRGGFKDLKPKDVDLIEIVEAGLKAPSGKNAQTTEFVIIDDSAIISQIRAMPAANKAIQQAGAYIVCIIDKNPEAIYEGFSFQLEDCAAAVENMLLAVTALGYASVWVDGWLRVEGRADKIAKLIHLPENKKIQIILPIGIPAEIMGVPRKKPFAERAWFNSFKS